MYSQMFRRIGAANTLGKGFISFLYRILHQLLQGISCLDNWEQKQMAVRLIFHTIQLFTTTMRDGWQFLLRKPAESRFAAIKTSACHHSRLVFFLYLHTDITLLCLHKVAAPSVFWWVHPSLSAEKGNSYSVYTKTATSASKDWAVVTVVFADKSRSACLLKEAWR